MRNFPHGAEHRGDFLGSLAWILIVLVLVRSTKSRLDFDSISISISTHTWILALNHVFLLGGEDIVCCELLRFCVPASEETIER
eukprot:SAG31_NODE_1273_length_9057_cov_13.364103_5_plen_84_part_00